MPVFYILRSDGAYVKFEGMDQDAITQMLQAQGLSCTFVSEDQFTAATRPQQG